MEAVADLRTSDHERWFRLRSFLRKTAIAAGVMLSLLVLVSHGRADEVDRALEESLDKYQADLKTLADWCNQQGLKAEAEKTRAWLQPADTDRLYVPLLPERIGRPELPKDTPADVVQWNERFAQLRSKQAQEYFTLARRAIRQGRASLAFDLVVGAVREDPDNESARLLLGYQKYDGQWHTLYEVRKLRAGQVWHEQFGWLPQKWVSRYERGERLYKGRWVNAEEDARLHRDIHDGWDIETEHYLIRTNHSMEAAARLGVKLEEFYRIWSQLFIRYYATADQVASLFDGRNRSRRVELPRHDVVYFRDREDYNRSLKGAIPEIGISIGTYVEQTRRAYFFAGKDAEDRTLYHEATHQLFHESRPVAPGVGRQGNFWIVEGIALYMESLRREDSSYTLGGFDDQRMTAAQYRLLHDNYYVPLAQLTALGMEQVQLDPKIATLYSEMAGMANFLIHYDGGRYRDAVVAYLVAVYTGHDTRHTLSQLTGVPYSELDKQYRKFMVEHAEHAGQQKP